MRALGLSLFAIASVAVAAPASAVAPVVIRQSVWLRAASMHDGDWVPSIALLLRGDLPAGSELVAEYRKPDGSVWGKASLRAGSADGRGLRSVGATMLDPELSIKEGGLFKVAVYVADATGAPKQSLFTGQFRVLVLPPSNGARQSAFAVDHDWVLGMAQLYLDPQHSDNPGLFATVWFKRHGVDCQDVDAALRYQGKVIATTANGEQGDKAMGESLRSTDDRDEQRYVQCRFELGIVKGYVNGTYQDQASWHELTKRPGDYELAITRAQKPARLIKFTVDKNGMIVRTGAVEPGYRGYRMLAPTPILGDGDGEWNKDAWAKEAFYGNADKPAVEAAPAALYDDWTKRPKTK